MLGTELRGKQLGIIGGGRIGRAVAAKAPAFGMTAVFAARRPSDQPGAERCSLDELLVTSDVVSHPRAADAGDAPSDRSQGARAHEAVARFSINTSRGPSSTRRRSRGRSASG